MIFLIADIHASKKSIFITQVYTSVQKQHGSINQPQQV